MADISNVSRFAQGLGLTASAVASGGILSFSFAVIPTLVLPGPTAKQGPKSTSQPETTISHISRQFRHSYGIGSSTMPFVALISTGAYSYLAYSFRQLDGPENVTTSNLYLLSAALAVSIVPYTFIAMMPTNKKLLARAQTADNEPASRGSNKEEGDATVASMEDAEVMRWLNKWVGLNSIRGLLPLAATVTALVATLRPTR